MPIQKTTREERFLLALYKDPSSSVVDLATIVKALALSEKQAKLTVNLLAGGDLLIKRQDGMVGLTEHGRKVAQGIVEEHKKAD
jgi:Mn-dependent DtxR family transcriptional regulator